jgi:tetratricopeptide (TPR) repeat protein
MNFINKLSANIILLFIFLFYPRGSFAKEQENISEKIDEAIITWNIIKLEELIREPDKVEKFIHVSILKVYKYFFSGDYNNALIECEDAPVISDKENASSVCKIVRDTFKITKDFKKQNSSRGNFIFFSMPGVDEILFPYADSALERAYEKLKSTFKFSLDQPVRIEILPDADSLSNLSTLAIEEIEESSVVAICKFGKIMLISPREMVYGYRWLDTATHEFIHLILTVKYKNRIPVWLQEGIARYLEGEWREEKKDPVPSDAAAIVAESVSKGKFIRFEHMSPSLARLGSYQATELAFAEVLIAVHMFVGKFGFASLLQMLDQIGSGVSDSDAMKSVASMTLAQFESELKKKYVRIQGKHSSAGDDFGIVFRKKRTKDQELKSFKDGNVKKFLHIGDLFSARNAYSAAISEYRKAKKIAGAHPSIQAKIASALISLDKFDEAIVEIKDTSSIFDSFVVLDLLMGKACKMKGDLENSMKYLQKVLEINPFDPEVHKLLVEVYGNLVRPVEMEIEKRASALLE